MNFLTQLPQLHNRYFFMRHGRSLANEAKIIVSHPENGLTGYGLTDEGIAQATQSVSKFRDAGKLDSSSIIYSSDFLRTRETAEIARKILGVEKVITSELLRERNFGEYELQRAQMYQEIWDAEDVNDPLYTTRDVESTASVAHRTSQLIRDLEEEYDGETILLVSHGDTLQILQTAFQGISPALHLTIPHLVTGEIREAELVTK